MRIGRFGLVAVLALVMASLPAVASQAEPVDGFLRSGTPLNVTGAITQTGSGHTVWIEGPAGPASPGLSLQADRIEVTEVTLEVRFVESPGPLNVSAALPPQEVQRETTTAEDAKLTIEAFGRDSDVLVFSSRQGPLTTTFEEAEGSLLVQTDPEGVYLRDGRRAYHNMTHESSDFDWQHVVEGPLVRLDQAPAFEMSGDPGVYVWDARATLTNETGAQRSYETGRSLETETGGATQKEEFTYLLIETRSARASVPTEQLETSLFAEAVNLGLDGEVRFPSAVGSLTTSSGTYHAANAQPTTFRGNVSMDVSPDARSDGQLALTSLDGQMRSTSLPFQAEPGGVEADAMVAAAGGLTLLGVVAWLLWGKGLSLAAVPLLGRRARRRRPVSPPAVEVDEPGELLFDPDRFALYHLVRARPGLNPDRCRDKTGIEDAPSQLALLAEHGLLDVVSEDPRRYVLPGAVSADRIDDLVFLRQPRAMRVAEMLAVHGLTSEQRLLERLEATDEPVPRGTASTLVDEFVRRGLAYREQGEQGTVVDSSENLFDLLKQMGETSLPHVS